MLNKFDSSLKNAFKDLIRFKYLSLSYFLGLTLGSVAFVAIAYLTANLIDSIIASNTQNIIVYISVLAAAIALVVILRTVNAIVKNALTRKIENYLSKQVVNLMTLNNLYSWNKVPDAQKIAFLNKNINPVVTYYHMSFFAFYSSFVSVSASFVSVGLLFPLALSYVIPLVLLLIVGQFIVISQYQKIGKLQGEIYHLRSSALFNTFGNYLMIKRNNYTSKYRNFYSADLNEIIKKENKGAKYIALIIFVNVGLSGLFSGVSALATISIAVSQGTVTFGAVLGIITISIATFQEGIQTINIFGGILQGKALFLQLIHSIVFKEFEDKKIENFKTISLESKNELSKEKNFVIKSGDKVLFEGPNGSGKSSLLEFFSGNFWNENILVKVNDQDFSDKNVFNLNQLSYLCTNLNYFEDLSLKDNLLFDLNIQPKSSVSEKEILMKELMKEFKLEHLDLNQVLEDKTITYSEGEKQRIQIVRSILSDKPILIYDESLANINVETRDIIYNYLLTKEKRTVLFVSHDFDKLKYQKLLNQIVNTDLFKVFENKEVNNA